jgi:hypothetical protein
LSEALFKIAPNCVRVSFGFTRSLLLAALDVLAHDGTWGPNVTVERSLETVLNVFFLFGVVFFLAFAGCEIFGVSCIVNLHILRADVPICVSN